MFSLKTRSVWLALTAHLSSLASFFHLLLLCSTALWSACSPCLFRIGYQPAMPFQSRTTPSVRSSCHTWLFHRSPALALSAVGCASFEERLVRPAMSSVAVSSHFMCRRLLPSTALCACSETLQRESKNVMTRPAPDAHCTRSSDVSRSIASSLLRPLPLPL